MNLNLISDHNFCISVPNNSFVLYSKIYEYCPLNIQIWSMIPRKCYSIRISGKTGHRTNGLFNTVTYKDEINFF